MRPRLTVCAVTLNSSVTLPLWAGLVRRYADELVLVVDASSTDGTADVARGLTDKVWLVEHPSFIEEVLDWALRRAGGEWILRLDDDEFMSGDFASHVDRLLGDETVSHYTLERRWVVPHGEGDYGWIRGHPWHPDPSVRLLRNVGSLYWHPIELHSDTSVLGWGRMLEPDEGVLYHLDLTWRSRQSREAKVRDRYAAKGRASCAEYYLHEEGFDNAEIVRMPGADIHAELFTTGRRRWAPDGAAPPVAPPSEGVVSLDEIRTLASGHHPVHTAYGVEFVSHTTPPSMDVQSGHLVEVVLRNRSDGVWCNAPGIVGGEVLLSYHWLDAVGRVVVHDGHRSLLPQAVPPGAIVTVIAGVWAPTQPGRHRLVWDLVSEGVAWFSEKGASTLEVEVMIEGSAIGVVDGEDRAPQGPVTPAPAYSSVWYERQQVGALSSAEVVMPQVLDLVRPRSVVDVGCALGNWLSVVRARGIDDILGIDGPWVDVNDLVIPKEAFRRVDLDGPFTVERTFDLAVSLEVAEHLTADSAAGFVGSLTALAPLVLFSAAIPDQGGDGHQNEQWHPYWADHFARRGFAALDCIRPRIWSDDRVEWWYRQNVLLFADRAWLAARPELEERLRQTPAYPLDLVHPGMFDTAMTRHRIDVDKAWALLAELDQVKGRRAEAEQTVSRMQAELDELRLPPYRRLSRTLTRRYPALRPYLAAARRLVTPRG